MAEFLPRDNKGRIQIRIWLVLVWLVCMPVIITTSLLVLGPPQSGSGGLSDSERGQMLGFGAALMSFWIAAVCAGIIWIRRRKQDRNAAQRPQAVEFAEQPPARE